MGQLLNCSLWFQKNKNKPLLPLNALCSLGCQSVCCQFCFQTKVVGGGASQATGWICCYGLSFEKPRVSSWISCFFFSPLMSNNKLWGSFFDDMDDPATDHQGAARCGSPLKTGPWLLLHHVCLLRSFSHCNAARHEGAEWMSSISLTQRG